MIYVLLMPQGGLLESVKKEMKIFLNKERKRK